MNALFRLLEMDEAIEALDAAIQYKDENIHVKQMEVRQSLQALAQVNIFIVLFHFSIKWNIQLLLLFIFNFCVILE